MAKVERALWTIVIFVCSYFFISSFKANDGAGTAAGMSVANIIVGAVVASVVIFVLYFAFAWWSKSQKDKALSDKNSTGNKAAENSKVTTQPPPAPESGKTKGWWAKKDLESKRWTLYTTTAAIAIIILYLPIKDETLRYTIAAWFILLMLHLVIWPFYTEKTSLMTKIVITSIIVIIGIAAVSPDEAIKIKDGGFSIGKKVITSTANGVSSLDNNYGKTSPVETVEAPTAKAPEGKTEVVQYDAYTGGWTEIPIKQGVNVEVRCPTGKVLLMATSREHPKGSTPWDCQQKAELGSVNDLTYFAQATEGVQPVIVKTSPWWSQ